MSTRNTASSIIDQADNQSVIAVTNLKKGFRTFGSFDSKHTSSSAAVRRYLGKLVGRGGRMFTALDGINLEVREGEVFGLLGPNGAGKTTLVKILSTLVLPDSGAAVVCGVDVVKNPRGALKKVQSVMAGNTGFDNRLTGRQNLEFSADLYGIPHDVAKSRIEELLQFSKLDEFGDEMLQKYSTGMWKKLLVCRALLSDVPVLLFDEPTANLDPVAASEFRSYIKNHLARERRRTIVLATHNLWEAEQICDRIALLRRGKVVFTGTPAEIREKVTEGVNLSLIISNSLNGSVDALVYGLREIDGVLTAESAPLESDLSRIQIEATNEMDYNAVLQEILSMKVKIHSIDVSQPSLEQAFLKLSRDAGS